LVVRREGLRELARWVAIVALIAAPFAVLGRVIAPDDGLQLVTLPSDLGRSVVGAVQAVLPTTARRAAVPARTPAAPRIARHTATTPPRVRPVPRVPPRTPPRARRHATGPGLTYVPIVTERCAQCRIAQDAAGTLHATAGAGAARAGGSFAVLDFGGRQGVAGVVETRDRIGLGAGQTPAADVPVLQVTDVAERVAYQLVISADSRRLRVVSPAGGLSAGPLDIATGAVVPNDGRSSLLVDVAAQANASLVVRVDGRTAIARNDLGGGDALRQRYLAAGILAAPGDGAALTVSHTVLPLTVEQPSGDTQTVAPAPIASAPPVTVAPPTIVAPPALSGAAVQGTTLTATTGTWSDSSPTTSIAWERCTATAGCVPIAGATGSTYALTAADVAATVRAEVTASNEAGTGSATSALSDPVAAALPTATAPPTVAGKPTQGQQLTADAGTWRWRNGAPSFAWQRCDATGANCAPIDGATSTTVTLGAADVGTTLRVSVTAPGYKGSTVVLSTASPVVLPLPPTAVAAPAVTGDLAAGSTLVVSTGTWSDPQPALSYAWQRCDATGASCAAIDGATSSSYVVTAADAGSTLLAVVTATNAAGSASAETALSGVVPTPPPPPVPAPSSVSPPTVDGMSAVGAPLTAGPGTWSDSAATISYAWQRCAADGTSCVAIDGATGDSYTPTADDLGSTLVVAVTATNASGAATATSAPTAPVGPPPPPSEPPTETDDSTAPPEAPEPATAPVEQLA
jgi:hypothetical protein